MNTFIGILKRWCAFNCVGALGIVVQLAALQFLARCLRLHYLPATALAVETAVLHNFVWHERWTWRDQSGKDGRKGSGSRGVCRRLLLFHLANGVLSIAGNLLLMHFFVETAGWARLPANLASIAAVSLLNFWAGDRIVFRDRVVSPGKERET